MRNPAPLLDPRAEQTIANELERSAPAFAPAWEPKEFGPGAAVVRAFARFTKALADRINAAPDKNRLAFFEQLGIELTPAQAARTPVVFKALRGVGDSHVPARTRLGADAPDSDVPLVFETEQAIALASSPLADVVTVWPGRDAYASHTREVLRGEPFTLFDPLQPVPHELYLAHDVALSIWGESVVQLDVDLETAAESPMSLSWEYWDGALWRTFKAFKPAAAAAERDSLDATDGLTRTGVIRLVSDCASTEATPVNGVQAFWIRGRSTSPIPKHGAALPHVRRIALRTTIERPLPDVPCSTLEEAAGLIPDKGVGGLSTLDFSKAVQPLGAQPRIGDAFHLVSDEAFAKPGAEVTICFRKVETPDEVVDQLGAEYEEDANNAERMVADAAIKAAKALHATGTSVKSILLKGLTSEPLDGLTQALDDLWAAVLPAEAALAHAWANDLGLDLEATVDPLTDPASAVAFWVWNVWGPPDGPAQSESQPPTPPGAPFVAPPEGKTGLRNPAFEDDQWPWSLPVWPSWPSGSPWPWHQLDALDLTGATEAQLEDAALQNPAVFAKLLHTFITENLLRVRNAGIWARDGALSANAAVDRLDTLTPIDAVRASGVTPPVLPSPVLAWEYFDGTRWRSLSMQGGAEARALSGDGPVKFVVPDDMDAVDVNGVSARWIRARLVSGGYGTIRMVSWRDEKTQCLNFFQIIQARPPSLDNVRLGYRYDSGWIAPERCVAYNDFRFVDHTTALRDRKGSIQPFVPVEDRTPTLYLGFDGPLPADRIGLWAGVEEVIGDESGPRMVWEGWTGQSWDRLGVEDGTSSLALPGTIDVLWPGSPDVPSANVIEARATEARIEDERQAGRFGPGDVVQLRTAPLGGESELAVVGGVDGRVIRFETPLDGQFQGALLVKAGLARFGEPRTWMRARLAADTAPRLSRLDSLVSNAVWAAHTETIENERLGAGNGQPNQVLFPRLRPILEGDTLEVRELQGPRASVEEPVLRAELSAAGVPEEDVRTEQDARSGKTDAVWIRWRRRSSLLFAQPDAREYAVEHSRGRVLFGNGEQGRIAPAGRENIRFRTYRTGGGLAGNVPADSVDQILAGVLAEGVTNVRPAEGGAGVESLDRLRSRAPTVVRHRSQAITASDYEALALQASPAVAVARALPHRHPNGRHAPGWVTVQIVPKSGEPRPVPSFELRKRVKRYLANRAPASMAGQIAVLPAEYIPVGVVVTIRPVSADRAREVERTARDALGLFLHPLTGGPDSEGWSFGRNVHLSDVAALLEDLAGVDYTAGLSLLAAGTPVGDHVTVPIDRMVVAGPLQIRLRGME